MPYRPPRESVSTGVARTLRRNLTPEERMLWARLRSAGLGVSFRRQEPIGRYVVDFVCYPARLVIELDGSQHLNSEADRVRDEALNADGFQVLRFWNNEVRANLEGVLERIRATFTERL
ncbi:endonuclease domain-containing protein [Deinococcus aetherius]